MRSPSCTTSAPKRGGEGSMIPAPLGTPHPYATCSGWIKIPHYSTVTFSHVSYVHRNFEERCSLFREKMYRTLICLKQSCSASTCTHVELRHTIELYLFYKSVYAVSKFRYTSFLTLL